MKHLSSDLTGRRRNALAAWITFLVCVFLLVTGGPAWSFERSKAAQDIPIDERAGALTTTLPPVTSGGGDDHCQSLLNTARYDVTARGHEMDRSQARQKAAAIGVVLGIKFALGPKEVAKSGRRKARLDVWQPSGGKGAQVLAVSAYRECKKEQALKALNSFRWKR